MGEQEQRKGSSSSFHLTFNIWIQLLTNLPLLSPHKIFSFSHFPSFILRAFNFMVFWILKIWIISLISVYCYDDAGPWQTLLSRYVQHSSKFSLPAASSHGFLRSRMRRRGLLRFYLLLHFISDIQLSQSFSYRMWKWFESSKIFEQLRKRKSKSFEVVRDAFNFIDIISFPTEKRFRQLLLNPAEVEGYTSVDGWITRCAILAIADDANWILPCTVRPV